MHMKNSFILGLTLGTILSGSLVVASTQIQAILNDTIKVTLDGVMQTFKDEKTNEIQYPITYKDRTYLPLRTVANLVGVDVDYNTETNTAILKTKKDIINTENYKLDFNYPDGPNISIIEVGESISGSSSLMLTILKKNIEVIHIKKDDPNLTVEITKNPQLVSKEVNGDYIAISEGIVGLKYSYLYNEKIYSVNDTKKITNGENFSNGNTVVINNSILDLNLNNPDLVDVSISPLGSFVISYPEGYNEENYYKFDWVVEDENIVSISENQKYNKKIEVKPINIGNTTITCKVSTADGKETINKSILVTVK